MVDANITPNPLDQAQQTEQQPNKQPLDFSKINVSKFKQWKKDKDDVKIIRHYAGDDSSYQEIMKLDIPVSEKLKIAKNQMTSTMKLMDKDYFGGESTSEQFVNKYFDKMNTMTRGERNLYSSHLSNLKNKERSEAIAKTKGSDRRSKLFRQYKKNEEYTAAATDIYSTVSDDAEILGGDVTNLIKIFKTDLGASQNEDGTWSAIDYENVANKSMSEIRKELWKVAQSLTIPKGSGYTNPITNEWILYPSPTDKNPDIAKRAWFNRAVNSITKARNTMRKVYDYEEFQESEQQRPEDDPLNIFTPSQVELNY